MQKSKYRNAFPEIDAFVKKIKTIWMNALTVNSKQLIQK